MADDMQLRGLPSWFRHTRGGVSRMALLGWVKIFGKVSAEGLVCWVEGQ
jgi:hypothetical protein